MSWSYHLISLFQTKVISRSLFWQTLVLWVRLSFLYKLSFHRSPVSCALIHFGFLFWVYLPSVLHLYICLYLNFELIFFQPFFFPSLFLSVFIVLIGLILKFFLSSPPCWFVSTGILPEVGDSLWSLGLGSAPPGPPAPGRLHRSISWAGTVYHMCAPHPLLSPANSWCNVFHVTCTIQRSTSIHRKQYRAT